MQINSLIETTKQAALPDAPSYVKDVKALKAGDKVTVPEEPKAAAKTAGPKPDPKLSPKDVVKVLLEAMVNNDTPSEDAGLRTVLTFSSSSNPYTSQPPERFIQAMRNSGYSILLGKYDEARVGKPEEGTGDDGVNYKVFPIKVEASNKAFLIAGEPFPAVAVGGGHMLTARNPALGALRGHVRKRVGGILRAQVISTRRYSSTEHSGYGRGCVFLAWLLVGFIRFGNRAS